MDRKGFLKNTMIATGSLLLGGAGTVSYTHLFYTFYSALTVPFLTKNLSASFFLEKEDTFEDILVQWKPYIVRQMEALLVVG